MIILHEIAAASAITPSAAAKKTLYISTSDGRPWLKDSSGVSTPLDGNTILYGTAAPTTEGVDGNFYIRTTTSFIYGPKAGGVWPAGISLVGPGLPAPTGTGLVSVTSGSIDAASKPIGVASATYILDRQSGDARYATAAQGTTADNALAKSANLSDVANGTTALQNLGGVAPTGSGAVVRATSPTLVTPTLGIAAATSINKVAITAPATGSTLTIADGKTLTANNSVAFTGTDGTTITLPTTSATMARTDAAQTFSGIQNFSGAVLASDGSAASPAYSFSGDATTGFFRAIGSQIRYSLGGTWTGFIGSNGLGFLRSGNPGVNWYSAGFASIETSIYSPSAGNICQGRPDAAAPVAQTSSVQSVVAGTSNTAGVTRTYSGSQGTGTGVGGSHVFQVAPAGSTGTAQNALVTAFTINGDGSSTFSYAVTCAAGINIGSSATNTVATSGGRLILSPWTGELWFGSGGSTGMRSANQFALSDTGSISWTNTSNNFYGATQDLYITRKAAANLRQGAPDAAAPVAQTSSVQSVANGTSNTAGAIRSFEDSAGTGNSNSGGYAFKVAPAGASGVAQNAFTTAFTINGNGSTTHSFVSILKNYTVGTLPTAASYTYGRCFVTDALTPVFGSTVAAGGAVTVPVYSDGSNWIVG